MNARPTLARLSGVTKFVAAALSIPIAIGLLNAVAGLFQRAGTPLEQIVADERACTSYAFVSERETCVRSYLTTSRVRNVASR